MTSKNGSCPGAGLDYTRRDLLLVLFGKHKKTHENGRGPSSMGAGWKSPAVLNLVGSEKPSYPKRRVAPAQGPDWLLLTEI